MLTIFHFSYIELTLINKANHKFPNSLKPLFICCLLLGIVEVKSQPKIKWINEQDPIKTGYIINLKMIHTDEQNIYFLQNVPNIFAYPVSKWRYFSLKYMIFNKYDRIKNKNECFNLKNRPKEYDKYESTYLDLIEIDNKFHLLV